MTALYTEQAARREYECDRCEDPILAGTRYARCALPPWTVNNYEQFWTVLRMHGRYWEACPRHAAAIAAEGLQGLFERDEP